MARSAIRDLVDELHQHNSRTARETVDEIDSVVARRPNYASIGDTGSNLPFG